MIRKRDTPGKNLMEYLGDSMLEEIEIDYSVPIFIWQMCYLLGACPFLSIRRVG